MIWTEHDKFDKFPTFHVLPHQERIKKEKHIRCACSMSCALNKTRSTEREVEESVREMEIFGGRISFVLDNAQRCAIFIFISLADNKTVSKRTFYAGLSLNYVKRMHYNSQQWNTSWEYGGCSFWMDERSWRCIWMSTTTSDVVHGTMGNFAFEAARKIGVPRCVLCASSLFMSVRITCICIHERKLAWNIFRNVIQEFEWLLWVSLLRPIWYFLRFNFVLDICCCGIGHDSFLAYSRPSLKHFTLHQFRGIGAKIFCFSPTFRATWLR